MVFHHYMQNAREPSACLFPLPWKRGAAWPYHFPSEPHLHPHAPTKQALATHLGISIPCFQTLLQSTTGPIAFPLFCKKLSMQWLWHVLKRFALPRKCCKLGPLTRKSEWVTQSSSLLPFRLLNASPTVPNSSPFGPAEGLRGSLPKHQITKKH